MVELLTPPTQIEYFDKEIQWWSKYHQFPHNNDQYTSEEEWRVRKDVWIPYLINRKLEILEAEYE